VYDKVFVTGSDKNNEWMLEWFLNNFKMHNTTPIVFADFGVSDKVREWADKEFDSVIEMPKSKGTSWFLKPLTMIETSKVSKKVCWIDTDCHVLRSIDDIFKYTEPQKLCMGLDKPWTEQFNETWHNSGVVAFEGTPHVLIAWEESVRSTDNIRGDQEVLHAMMKNDPLRRRVYIKDLPNFYNWLRLQVQNGDDSFNKRVMHWTGRKGKDQIRELMKSV